MNFRLVEMLQQNPITLLQMQFDLKEFLLFVTNKTLLCLLIKRF